MEEKERYEWNSRFDEAIKDNQTGDIVNAVEVLNQQDKRIKELEEDQALLIILISGIDNLMHDKDYRFKNDNGTWYSRQSCKDLTNEEVYQEIIDEINQLDINFEILDKENQQLKQSQNQKAIEELNNLKRYCHEWYSWSDVAKRLDEIVDDRIKELGGGENE